MDPLSIFSTISSTADALKTVKAYRSRKDGQGIQRILSETEILYAMTLESASMLEGLASAPPHSAEVALQQCEINAMHLKTLIANLRNRHDSAHSLRRIQMSAAFDKDDIANIEDILGAFRVSASLLRQIAADAVTHDLIKSQMNGLEAAAVASMSRKHPLPEQKTDMSSDTDSAAEDDEDDHENQQGARPIRQKQGPSSAPWGSGAFGSSDIFKQPGSICLSSAAGPHAVWHPVWIKLDSGSDFNLISRDVLNDINFDGPYEEPKPMQSMTLDGMTFRLEQRVKLRWGFHKSMKLLNTIFYTVENAPFDVLINKSVIVNRDLLNESRYLLLNLKVFGRNKGKFHGIMPLSETAYLEDCRKRLLFLAEKLRTNASKKANDLAAMAEAKLPQQTSFSAQSSGAATPLATPVTDTTEASTSSLASASMASTAPSFSSSNPP
ncbi:hypothetical protein MMC22_011783 [Lobaria immixta]|nr:hypothetical protein [Lobaria immixta]